MPDLNVVIPDLRWHLSGMMNDGEGLQGFPQETRETSRDTAEPNYFPSYHRNILRSLRICNSGVPVSDRTIGATHFGVPD